MSSKNIPRLFINKELKAKIKIKLNSNNKHYLKNVLRLSEGKVVNIFNGIDGEWETEIDSCLWKQKSFPYQAKCLDWIRAEYQNLASDHKEDILNFLKDNNCESLVEKV